MMRVRFRTLARQFREFDPVSRRSVLVFQEAGFVVLELTSDALGDLTVPGAFTAKRRDGPVAGRIILDLTHPPEPE